MFDPLTLGLIILGSKVAQKIANRNRTVTCRWCAKEITEGANSAACCDSTLCQTCKPEWQQAGGSNCVFCNRTKP